MGISLKINPRLTRIVDFIPEQETADALVVMEFYLENFQGPERIHKTSPDIRLSFVIENASSNKDRSDPEVNHICCGISIPGTAASDFPVLSEWDSGRANGMIDPGPYFIAPNIQTKLVKNTASLWINIIRDIPELRASEQTHMRLRVAVALKNRQDAFKLAITDTRTFPYNLDTREFGISANLQSEERSRICQEMVSWAAAIGDQHVLNIYLRELQHIGMMSLSDGLEKHPLMWAAMMGRDKAIQTIWEAFGKQNHVKDLEGRTALSWAAGNGHVQATRLLLRNLGMNHPDKNGLSPLSWAARNGQLDIIEMLLKENELESGSKGSDFDAYLKTPLQCATKMGCVNAVDIIIRHYRDQELKHKKRASMQEHATTELTDKMIEYLLQLLVWKKREIMLLLLRVGLKTCRNHRERDEWLLERLHFAARKGMTDLAKILVIQFKAPIQGLVEDLTALCVAAEEGHTGIVRLLLDAGAELEFSSKRRDRAISLAVEKGQDEVVKVLLERGADIDTPCRDGATVMALAVKHATIFRMVSERDKNGKLAGDKNIHPNIDSRFNAKVVDFVNSGNTQKPKSRDEQVQMLLKNPKLILTNENEDIAFRWIHLPANNMRWVEVLISGLYGSQSAYRILEPSRWVSRQHHGNDGAHHARFMQPFCQSFDLTPTTQPQVYADKNVVLFMPYLHWEECLRLNQAKEIIRNGAQPENAGWTKYQKLLNFDLFRDKPPVDADDRNRTRHDLRLLHVRRTLDQYYYYTLKNTNFRDNDQTVSRYLQAEATEPKVVAVVDQLWLWVLVGPSGRADTVITCFPGDDHLTKRDRSEVDPDCVTDVLQNILLHMLYEPQAVKGAYDLVGVITSRCSRAFLEPSRARRCLQFSEIYDSAIGNIMNEEAVLFNQFSDMVKLRQKNPDPVREIQRYLNDKGADDNELREVCQAYHEDTMTHEIPDRDEIASLMKPGDNQKQKLVEVLQRLAHFHALGISNEITLLREIKDIQDELNIVAMVFEEQKTVLMEVQRSIHSMGRGRMYSSNGLEQNAPRALQRLNSQAEHDELGRPATRQEHLELSERVGVMPSNTTEMGATEENTPMGEPLDRENRRESGPDPTPDISANKDTDTMAENRIIDTNRRKTGEEVYQSYVWGTGRDPEGYSLPLRTIQLSIDGTERMAQRAAKAYNALDFLVNLKQKQSDVLDGRSMRIQAEDMETQTRDMQAQTRAMRTLAKESLKMTEQSARSGQTLMVFTIVTIVFLPMSFMAAFFTIDITEFRRNEKGTLGLAYVSEIIFPISIAISAVLICIAFNASAFEEWLLWLGGWISSFVPAWKRRRVSSNDDDNNKSSRGFPEGELPL
ncbi:hypothetical protein F5Y04DRAFT_278254 [Hypomontagnella monticulosa]|nr:hypothetical protein F5Y04DRAFT_278254 [Hypomontagnella monticulosa]